MAPSTTAARKPPRISARDAKFATVIVGAESVSFVVHKELLTYHSPFFSTTLNGRFEEATTSTVRLEEVKVNVFEFFVHWLYHQRLPNKDDDPELYIAWESDNDYGELKMENLIYLNVFCDKYDVPLLKHLSLDHLFEHYEDFIESLPSYRSIFYALKNVSNDSPLCRFLTDCYCNLANGEAWATVGDSEWEDLCEDFEPSVLHNFVKMML